MNAQLTSFTLVYPHQGQDVNRAPIPAMVLSFLSVHVIERSPGGGKWVEEDMEERKYKQVKAMPLYRYHLVDAWVDMEKKSGNRKKEAQSK